MRSPLTDREGAELKLRASGPMPAGAAEHLRDLIASALTRRPRLKRYRPEEIDAIEDPVVASAFAQAEEELAELDAAFARREEELQRKPPAPLPAAAQASRRAELAENVREVVRDAERAGIRFFAVTETDQE